MRISIRAILPAFILLYTAVKAQETPKDSIHTNMDELVVTGQIEPQSIKKSVFNVQVITEEDIKRQAGNNMADVLNQYLNITVQPSSGEGRSTVSMFGLDGQYLKILVDNVPLVSDTGLGNNIDLTQINLDDIQQIEIIEGSMGVTHGANAVSGIINIITKKSARNKWEITTTVQEETIGDEYAPLYDEGRHIQSLRIAHSINKNWFVAVGGNRNDFEGYQGEFGGKEFTNNPNNPDQLRGYSWQPKEQYFGNALVRYQKNNTRIFYKFDYFDEKIDSYNRIVNNERQADGRELRYSDDRRYFTNKLYNHLNAVGKVLGLDYNASVSYQKQQRDVEKFRYYIQLDTERNNEKEPYQETEVLYSIGTLSNFFKTGKVDLQLGYEFVNTNGYSSSLSGSFSGDDQEAINLNKRLENYDFFTAAEIKVTDKFSVRPGFRYSFQSKFEDQWAASMGLRQILGNGFEARLSYGRSYRTPNYDELYTYFVDSNHNVQGNPDLNPESGHSIEGSVKKFTYFESGLQMKNTLSASYNTVDDRIENIIVEFNPLKYQFINIDSYKRWSVASTHKIKYNNLQAKAGVSVMGISRAINSGLAQSDDEFLVNYQFNANVAYNVPKWNTLFSLYYKHNGKQQQYVQENTLDNPEFVLSEIESFGLMDASVRKDFFKNKFSVTVGARNLLDVVSIRSSQASGGDAHTAGTTNILMGYGRSYFMKLTYNLNFN